MKAKEITEDAFSRNTKLSHLLLRANEITDILPDTLAALPYLSWIDLGRNNIKTIHSELFKSNGNLRIIDLDQNGIDKICQGAFETQEPVKDTINTLYNIPLGVR